MSGSEEERVETMGGGGGGGARAHRMCVLKWEVGRESESEGIGAGGREGVRSSHVHSLTRRQPERLTKCLGSVSGVHGADQGGYTAFCKYLVSVVAPD